MVKISSNLVRLLRKGSSPSPVPEAVETATFLETLRAYEYNKITVSEMLIRFQVFLLKAEMRHETRSFTREELRELRRIFLMVCLFASLDNEKARSLWPLFDEGRLLDAIEAVID